MMKNILIPTDFSENAWNALKYAQQLFKQKKCNFYLLHVSDSTKYPIREVAPEIYEDVPTKKIPVASKKQLSDLLELVEVKFRNKNHQYFGIHEHGFFLETIKKNIVEKKIGLIAMGTKGDTRLGKRIIGSKTGDVITKVQCNTFIVPKGVRFTEPKEFAFPTDYNIFYSYKILEAVSDMLRLGKGNMHVVNVSKMDRLLTKAQEGNQEYLFDYLNEAFPNNSSFHTLTQRNVKMAIQGFVESQNIDMIIMVAKNLNFLQQILFDSLSEKMSFHTSVPYFVIHE